MKRISKTWWGQRFIEALEVFTDSGRLSRGRSYAGEHRIKEWDLSQGKVSARVRGNVNPYFGVYKEPVYRTTVEMTLIPAAHWKKVIRSLGAKAGFVAKLMANEMPENIEEAFAELNVHLLPCNQQDFKVSCSCPDYAVPCKHIAGVCYRLAALLDSDPFLLFELRGLPRKTLYKELAKSPLGKTLAEALSSQAELPPPAESYYTRPRLLAAPESVDPKSFWHGDKALPSAIEPAVPAAIPAVLIKKGGDYPPFWDKHSSFIAVMEEFYQRIRKGAKQWM